ncbi:MAG: hypothetical protein J2P54_08470 [Bradyrhizobiaceae bacterium]|nr:hypothetical protein [Bradyrhizobiaceae bacterium]
MCRAKTSRRDVARWRIGIIATLTPGSVSGRVGRHLDTIAQSIGQAHALKATFALEHYGGMRPRVGAKMPGFPIAALGSQKAATQYAIGDEKAAHADSPGDHSRAKHGQKNRR